MKKYIPHMIITAVIIAVVYLIIENRKRKQELAPILPLSEAIEMAFKDEKAKANDEQNPKTGKPARKRNDKGQFVKEEIIEDAEIETT